MGLTARSTGKGAMDRSLTIERGGDLRVVALAGNPNVGKSTVFNQLTGMRQHTGNWPGKTVTNAQGRYRRGGQDYLLVDLPGAYSLLAHSAEEEVARDFICFEEPDAVIVVCDATCLERNLNLALQTLEVTPHVVLCVNLLDEAGKKQIRIDLPRLSRRLGVPVIGTSARSSKGLEQLTGAVERICRKPPDTKPLRMRYPEAVERALGLLVPVLEPLNLKKLPARWIAVKLLSEDTQLLASIDAYLKIQLRMHPEVRDALEEAQRHLTEEGIAPEKFRDMVAASAVLLAEELCMDTVSYQKASCHDRDRALDRLLTSRATGIPVMLLLLAFVFWLTIAGANVPSRLLSDLLFQGQGILAEALSWVGAPPWLNRMLTDGVYRTLAWVVSVMLPPMAIFFPLFTLLEDSGYLPRIAFNLDKGFQRCRACGKQALTMCMGFGCNAAGITGARIIDSPRERLIAIITNNFVPCNGRFPTLISIITMFFIGSASGLGASLLSALLLTGIILLGVLMTFAVSFVLSQTILKGVPSSFTLELPPYRRPQIVQVIVRSIFDRTLFVLGRAAAVAAPAGLLIWCMANLTVGGQSLLAHCSGFFDPFARLLGLDGVILMAFILGFPANEIVVPVMLMAYLSTGSLTEINDLTQLKTLLTSQGWTWLTATCTMLFSLLHWPCSTSCMTIYKETHSIRWTLVSFLVPTVIGMVICGTVAGVARLFALT